MATKLPKSMGACADLLHKVREQRLAADRVAASLKAEEARIKDHIIDNLDKNSTGAAGKQYRVQVMRKRKWRVNPERWDKFHAWISKNKRFDMLQKRISDEAIKDFMETPNNRNKLPAPPPGIEPFDYVTVSLTKV